MNDLHADGKDEGARGRAPEPLAPEPLPRAWLPEARAPEGHPVWQLRVARVMSAAGPALAPPPWWSEMGRWWKVSAGLAAASLLLFFGISDRPPADGAEVAGDEFALGMVVAEGDAAAFWGALGVPANPVLALLTFENPGAMPAPTAPEDQGEGGVR